MPCKECGGPLTTDESKVRGVCEGCSKPGAPRPTFEGKEPFHIPHWNSAPEGSTYPVAVIAGLAVMFGPLAYFVLNKKV